MKTIGLIGGMSWESTTSYYQYEVFEWYFSTLKKIEEIIKIAEE